MNQGMQHTASDPWDLVVSGQYEQALAVYSRLYDEESSSFYLGGRGLTYLLMGKPAAALADFELRAANTESRFLADTDYLRQGICYWYLDHPGRTVALWRQGLTASYTDAAGGVEVPALLLYAAERVRDAALRKEALGLLRRHARRKLDSWPGGVVPFLLGRMGVAELEHQVNAASSEIMMERQQCQADFYIGLRALREGDHALFQARMTRCAENPYGPLEQEFYLARWEVERHFPEPAFAQGYTSVG